MVKEGAVFIARPSKENRQLVLKRPRVLDRFQGRVFKGKVKEKVTGCVISLSMTLCLVDGEVTGWCHRGSRHQSSGSSWSGGYVYVVSIQLLLPSGRGFSICKATLECISDTCLLSMFFRKDKRVCDSTIWLIYCLNFYQFSWPKCYLLLLPVHILPIICDSGEAWESKAFLQTRGKWRTWQGARGWSVLGRPHGVLLSYTMNLAS